MADINSKVQPFTPEQQAYVDQRLDLTRREAIDAQREADAADLKAVMNQLNDTNRRWTISNVILAIAFVIFVIFMFVAWGSGAWYWWVTLAGIIIVGIVVAAIPWGSKKS